MSIAPLTLIMGVGRSGTTALFRSLARDPRVSSYGEGEGPLYDGWYPRPEAAVRPFLAQNPRPILTKPLNEPSIREVTDVLDEFAAYDPRLIWIYRDPVNVYHSWLVEKWTAEPALPFFVHQWNGMNRRFLSAIAAHAARITLVRYEDLVLDADVWRDARNRVFMEVEGESLFRPDSRAGRRLVPGPVQDLIDAETAQVFEALERARTFRPRAWRRVLSGYGRGLIRVDARRRSWGRSAQSTQAEAVASRGTATESLTPDRVAGLALWLDAGDLAALPDGSAVREWPAKRGAPALCGPGRSGGIFRSPSTAGDRASVLFPPGPDDAPDGAIGGFRCIGENDWRFLHDGSPWTILVVHRALSRRRSLKSHALLQVSDGNGGEFGLGVTVWGVEVAMISTPGSPADHGPAAGPVVMAAPVRAPERVDDWKVATFVHHPHPPSGMALSSYLGHGRQSLAVADPKREYPRGAVSSALHIGYTSGANAGPFSGDLSELIIYRSALDEASRTAVVRYLAIKHGGA